VSRPVIPANVERAVLVEAGHRCAIPTCRATTVEIAHIEPWSLSNDHSFSNLIALCPNCHTRYDQKKEIDRKSIYVYKQNLALLNNRYGEFERRFFDYCVRAHKESVVVGAGAELLLFNAELDGLVTLTSMQGDSPTVLATGELVFLPIQFVCVLTGKGRSFVDRYSTGVEPLS
jgi:hypothetical protein